ncbi:MAG: alpha/beta fold hydrolase [Planctomycetota bacterium]
MPPLRRPRRAAPTAAPGAWICALFAASAACSTWIPAHSPTFESDETVQRRHYRATIADGRDVEVSYLRSGNAEAQRVIFVHGTPGQATAWLAFLRDDPQQLEHVALDRPGFGATRPLQEVTSLRQQAAAIEPLLQPRNGRWPILVGHSLGGPIVAAVAAYYPDKVDGIVIAAGSIDPDQEDLYLAQFLGEEPPFVWLVPTPLRHANREVLELETELVMLGHDLDRIRCRTIIVHGTDDALVPYGNVAYMQDKLVRTEELQLVRLEGGDHFLPWNAQDVLRDAVARLVAQDLGPTDPFR